MAARSENVARIDKREKVARYKRREVAWYAGRRARARGAQAAREKVARVRAGCRVCVACGGARRQAVGVG